MLSPQQMLGPYEILAVLGEGGMGRVYRARDPKLNRNVAIKVLPEAFASDADRLSRFSREAQTLAALNHQNIAHVYDAGRADAGVAYLVMELVDGEDLSAVIARGMAVEESLPIARQIVDALEAAHDAGIVHRDLKPANIKVRADGTVKVLDFGLAKASGVGPDTAGLTMTSPAMTAMGVILGTASYMSPEQAKGRPVDRRADIWAFGAIWFEMLTGRAPFPGETITDVIAAVVTREPDWALLPASTPSAVRTLIARCLEKDPKQRLRDIGEVRLALAGGKGIDATKPASRSGALGWIAAGVLSLALVASFLWQRPGAQTLVPAPLEYDVMPAGKSTLKLDSRPALTISPDGNTIVFSATEQGVTKLYVRRRNDADVHPLPGTDGGTEPIFSPDGNWLAFANQTDLMRMSLDGTPASIARLNDSRGMAWLNDTELVISPEASVGLSIVGVNGGAPKPLTTLDPKSDDRTHRWPAVVPGGKAVLFTVGKLSSPDNYDASRIDAVIVATGERRTVMEGASFVRVLANGFLIYAKAGAVFAVPFDSERLVTTGVAVPLLQGVATDTTTGATHVAFAADGTLTYVPGGSSTIDRQLVWVDRKGTPTPLALPPGLYNDIRVSPDGHRIAVLVGQSGSGDISIYDTHSTAFTRFTFDGTNATPVWSRDGQSLYYASLKLTGDETVIRRRPADGSREAEVVGTTGTRGYIQAIDRLEQNVYLHHYPLRPGLLLDIAKMPIGGGPSSVFIGGQGSQFQAAISPDGRWLAYRSDEGGRPDVYVRDLTAAGGHRQVSTTGGVEPHWSIDGSEIFYRNDTRLMSATVTTKPEFRSNPPTVMFDGIYNLRSDTGISYDIDPRTGRFLMVRPAGQVAGAPSSRVRVVVNWMNEMRRARQTQR